MHQCQYFCFSIVQNTHWLFDMWPCEHAFYVYVLVAVAESIATSVRTTARQLEDDWYSLLDISPKKSGRI